VVLEFGLNVGAVTVAESVRDGLELAVERELLLPEAPDEHVVVIPLTRELLQLLLEGVVVVVEVLEEFPVALQFSLVLADALLQQDLPLVDFLPMVL